MFLRIFATVKFINFKNYLKRTFHRTVDYVGDCKTKMPSCRSPEKHLESVAVLFAVMLQRLGQQIEQHGNDT